MWKYSVIMLLSYLLGSVNCAIILSRRIYDTDVRSCGSGNAGATNAARVFGMRFGLITLGCDALKMLLSAGIGWLLCGQIGVTAAGIGCLIGHCWPCYFDFRGGKGVSVGAMTALLIDWRVFLAGAAVFFLLFLLTHTVSVCSVSAALSLPLTALLLSCPPADLFLAGFTALLVLFQHRSNLIRLAHGTEGKFVPGQRRPTGKPDK